MKKKNRWVIGILILICISCGILKVKKSIDSTFDLTSNIPLSSEKELKDNLLKNELKILELKKYYNAITPKDYEAYLEFKENNHIDLCVLKISNKSETKICLFQEWDIDPYNYKHNSMSDIPAPPNSPKKLKFEEITTLLNWNTNTFKKIKEYLDKATCISITNGEPTNIGYKRSGMGEYFYNIFDNSIDKDKVKFYNDSCKYRLYNEKIVLEYGGGAIGSQCFPGN